MNHVSRLIGALLQMGHFLSIVRSPRALRFFTIAFFALLSMTGTACGTTASEGETTASIKVRPSGTNTRSTEALVGEPQNQETPAAIEAQSAGYQASASVGGASASVDVERGRAYYTTCLACHGTRGEGNQGMHGPNLTKLDAEYFLLQMRNYRTYVRGGKEDFYGWQMNGRANALPSDLAVRDVIAFIQTLPDVSATSTIKGNIEAGRSLYKRHCESCHGSHGEGVAAFSAPGLAGLEDWYQLKQLENYRKGLRGSTEADVEGRRMRPYAEVLGNAQAMTDVVAYIATLGKSDK